MTGDKEKKTLEQLVKGKFIILASKKPAKIEQLFSRQKKGREVLIHAFGI